MFREGRLRGLKEEGIVRMDEELFFGLGFLVAEMGGEARGRAGLIEGGEGEGSIVTGREGVATSKEGSELVETGGVLGR